MRLSIQSGMPLVLALHIAMPLCAQWPEPIAPGTRVQARVPETQYQTGGRRGHLIRGRVTALAPDTLYLAVTDSLGPLAVPRSLIKHLAYSRGVPSRATSALTRGLVAGASTALLLVLLNEMDDASDRRSSGTAGLVGGGIGFTLGATMGALFPRERWKSVRVGVTVATPR